MTLLEGLIEPIDPESAGTAPIDPVFTGLKDQDLAQRLSTLHFGKYLAARYEDEARPKIELLDEANVELAGVNHGVVLYRVTAERHDGSEYSYQSLSCSHDHQFTLDERFLDEDGNPTYSGMSSSHVSGKCSVKESVNWLRRAQIMEEYQAREDLKDPLWSSWKKGAMATIILDLAERKENEEWLGWDTNSSLYVQHLAEILDMDFREASDIVDQLVEEQKLSRSGNIIMPWRKGWQDDEIIQAHPTRLWGTYKESYGENYIREMKVYLPASWSERPVARAEVFLRGELEKAFDVASLRNIQDDGSIPPGEEAVLKRLLSTQMDKLRVPYASPFELPLTMVEGEPFSNEGVDPTLPTGFHTTVNYEEFNLAISAYLPRNDEERRAAALVPHPIGEVKTPQEADRKSLVLVDMFYGMDFGMDQGDIAKIEDAIDKMARRLSDGK